MKSRAEKMSFWSNIFHEIDMITLPREPLTCFHIKPASFLLKDRGFNIKAFWYKGRERKKERERKERKRERKRERTRWREKKERRERKEEKDRKETRNNFIPFIKYHTFAFSILLALTVCSL